MSTDSTLGSALDSAVEFINRKFGSGYASENPALVGAWLQAAATIEAGRRISDFLGRSDCPTVAEAIKVSGDDIQAGLDRLADKLMCIDFSPVVKVETGS